MRVLKAAAAGVVAAVVIAEFLDHAPARANDAYPFAANKHARYLWAERIGENQYVALVQLDVGQCVYWLTEYTISSRAALAILPATCPQAERAR